MGMLKKQRNFYQTDDLVNIYNMIAENPELWQRRFEQSRDRSEISDEEAVWMKPSQGNCKEK